MKRTGQRRCASSGGTRDTTLTSHALCFDTLLNFSLGRELPPQEILDRAIRSRLLTKKEEAARLVRLDNDALLASEKSLVHPLPLS